MLTISIPVFVTQQGIAADRTYGIVERESASEILWEEIFARAVPVHPVQHSLQPAKITAEFV